MLNEQNLLKMIRKKYVPIMNNLNLNISDDINKYSYVNNERCTDYAALFNQANMFRNKNKKFSKELAVMFLDAHKNDLIAFAPIFTKNAIEKIPELANNLYYTIPQIINKKELIKKNAQLSSLQIDKIDQTVKNLKKVYTAFEDETVFFLKNILQHKNLYYIFNPYLIYDLFDDIRYLFNYNIYNDDLSYIKREMPNELKELIKKFLINLSQNPYEGKRSIKTLINREIYKNKIDRYQIYDVINLFKENEYIYCDTVSTRKFINLELPYFQQLIEKVNDKLILEKIYRNILSIKKPKKTTKQVELYLKNKIQTLNKENRDNIFLEAIKEQKLILSFNLNNNLLSAKDILLLDLCIKALNKSTEKDKLQISSIYLTNNNIKKIVHFHISYQEKNPILNEEYYKSLIIYLLEKKNMWGKYYNNPEKELWSLLNEFRLSYLINNAQNNDIDKKNISTKKNKI